MRGRSSRRILVSAAGYERALDGDGAAAGAEPATRPTAALLNDAEGALRAQLGAVERARAAAGPDAGPTDADLLRLDDVAMQHLAAGSLARVELRTDRSGRRLGTVVDGTPRPASTALRRLASTTTTSSQRRGAGSTPARSAPTTRAAPAPAPPAAAPAATIARAWAPAPTSTTTATSTSTTR